MVTLSGIIQWSKSFYFFGFVFCFCFLFIQKSDFCHILPHITCYNISFHSINKYLPFISESQWVMEESLGSVTSMILTTSPAERQWKQVTFLSKSMPINAKDAHINLMPEWFYTIYAEFRVKGRCLHFFMSQISVFHVSEESNTDRGQFMFQIFCISLAAKSIIITNILSFISNF